jgi:hypothetical protein
LRTQSLPRTWAHEFLTEGLPIQGLEDLAQKHGRQSVEQSTSLFLLAWGSQVKGFFAKTGDFRLFVVKINIRQLKLTQQPDPTKLLALRQK